MNSIYQVIKNEYNSDDGHYDDHPIDDLVYAEESYAIDVRNALNLAEITTHNLKVNKDLTERRKEWEANGKPKGQRARGGWHSYWHPHYSTEAIKEREEDLYTGDFTDADAVQAFAAVWGRRQMTYYTIETLRLFK